jgi:malate/lactate dehydrogenase
MKEVIVVIGPGQIGQAIVRRVGFGKHLVLADMRQDSAKAAAITGSDFLMDGGVNAAYWFGNLAPK